MSKDSQTDDQYSPEEAQRRFEALVRAAAKTPPLRRKDVPTKRQESKRKKGKGAKRIVHA
jgi:hypothetical protein